MPRVRTGWEQTGYLGIDPGASGGLALIHGGLVELSAMPATEEDVYNWLIAPVPGRNGGNVTKVAVIEKVQGFIGNAHPGSAMFKFGMSYGGLRMALIAARIPFTEVTPAAWQKKLGITPRGKDEEKRVFKNRLKARAQQLYPGAGVTLATADALLLASYCRRKENGIL